MVTLSHNNHFKFGFRGRNWFENRQTVDDQLILGFGAVSRPVGSFRDECLATARLIYEENAPLTVALSGGMDSEVALRSFVDQNIPVKIAIMRYADGINAHEIAYAFDYCAAHDLAYEVVDLDIMRFWADDGLAYAERDQHYSPQIACMMWLMDQLDGYIVGGGTCPPIRRGDDGTWHLYSNDRNIAFYRHFVNQGRDACPFFFFYTPEVLLAFMRDPLIVELINNRTPHDSSITIKGTIYNAAFPSLPIRPKYTGFETVQPQDAVVRRRMRERLGVGDDHYRHPLDDFMRQLTDQA